MLIDPIELPDLAVIGAAIGDAEWILHAANQDLPCLAELGLRPQRLFDTELAGRLLGDERVALGTMVEQHLGVRLEKGHSAADWSTRPLPHDWLVYAALDVELLVALRDGARRTSSSGPARASGRSRSSRQSAPAPPHRRARIRGGGRRASMPCAADASSRPSGRCGMRPRRPCRSARYRARTRPARPRDHRRGASRSEKPS